MSEQVLEILPSRVKDLVEVSEREDAWVFRKKRSLSDAEYRAVLDVVQDYGGKYVRGQQVFVIPKEAIAPRVAEEESKPVIEKAPISERSAFEEIPIDRIVPGPSQPRSSMDEQALSELTESVKAHGVMETIVVRPAENDTYELISGYRRLEAAKRAELTMIGARVQPMSDWEAEAQALVLNVQREDLSDYDIARGLKRLLEKFPGKYPNQTALAGALRKSDSWVSRHIAMLEVEDNLPRGKREVVKSLSERQVRALKKIPEEFRQEYVETQFNDPDRLPSVRDIEAYARAAKKTLISETRPQPEKPEGAPVKKEEASEPDKGPEKPKKTEDSSSLVSGKPQFLFETDIRLHCDFVNDDFFLEGSIGAIKAFKSFLERRGWIDLSVREWLAKMSTMNQIRWRNE